MNVTMSCQMGGKYRLVMSGSDAQRSSLIRRWRGMILKECIITASTL